MFLAAIGLVGMDAGSLLNTDVIEEIQQRFTVMAIGCGVGYRHSRFPLIDQPASENSPSACRASQQIQKNS